MVRPGAQGLGKSASSTNADRARTNDTNMRTKATIDRLNLYRSGGKAKRNKDGKIVKAAPFQSWATSGEVARVQADRRWFGNTRTITQDQLQNFREAMVEQKKNPYAMVMRQNKLPMSLIQDTPTGNARVHVLDTEPFENVFGPTAQRKKPRVASDLSEYLSKVAASNENYEEDKDLNIVDEGDGTKEEVMDRIFTKGQSRRIWNELYKVIDSSDVVVQVLDARDPLGTRSHFVENYLKKEKPHKQVIFLLNKCDLVPTWVTARWVKILSQDSPTLAFHASITNPFGKGAFISLLRQFGKLHADKKQISVGFIGYPNVGKSSVINALRAKKVCNVAPVPGETKVWQYVTLMKRIFLVDCPGVVYQSTDTETDIVLKGVVRVENLKDAADHIPGLLSRTKEEYVKKTYLLSSWENHIDFLEQLAKRYGKLFKGGEPDINTVAKMVLMDWLRGKIPYFVPPPQLASNSTKPTAKALLQNKNQASSSTASEDHDVQEEIEGGDEKALLRVALTAIGASADAADEEEEEDEEEDDGEEQVYDDSHLQKNQNEDEDEDGEEEDGEEEEELSHDEEETSLKYRQMARKIKSKQQKSEKLKEKKSAAAVAEKKVEQSRKKVKVANDVPSKPQKSVALEDDIDFDSIVSNIEAQQKQFTASSTGASKVNPKKHARDEEEEEDEDNDDNNDIQEDDDEDDDDDDDDDSDDEPILSTKTSAALKKKGVQYESGFKVSKVAKSPSTSPKSPKSKALALKDDSDDDDDNKKRVKEPRLTTNKQKIGTHYYETANVKNRNKNRKIPKQPKTGKSGRPVIPSSTAAKKK